MDDVYGMIPSCSGIVYRPAAKRGATCWARCRAPSPGDAFTQLLDRNVQRFRGGLVFQAHGRCVSLNSRLTSNREEEEDGFAPKGCHLIRLRPTPSAPEATQGQMDGRFCQLPYRCHLEELASVRK